VNLIVRKAERRPHLKTLLIGAALGVSDAQDALSLGTLKEILL
jgi:thiamine phosphate synthase YjbQ (UPF0047 family)